ncbi:MULTISPECIES: magnesium/cobalt transporter CorA [Nonlabens]|uniref:magnesium/cobalt transporter CorA n=1 Tax=Nonlabens TaxID=363408 RepID=UPI0007611DEA|nr:MULTISPECIES: magnesium/cobalt transporter CorA [Nonlabens]MEE2802495.1 magnesium/cobalt transporter CorA [Bacteroidota bacterium]
MPKKIINKLRIKRKAAPKTSQTVFTPPGTISYVGVHREGEVITETIAYGPEHYEKHDKIVYSLPNDYVKWYNLDGIHDIEKLKKIGKRFDIHPLLLEDVANTTQRPKTEFYPNYVFQCIKMISYDEKDHDIEQEQVSIILNEHEVVTFQEQTGDVFGSVRSRIENNHGRIRTSDSDYLFYALIDSVLDHYFIAIEKIGDYLDVLEDEIFNDPEKESLNKVQNNKRVLINLRRSVYPLRESISRLLKEESRFLQPQTKAYFQDAYDHCIQIIETIESYREINTGLKDMYLSSVSHKMNQIMQVLTIISSIFIPMTFLAGIYGMNFEHIPELTWEHGYMYFWIICAVMFVGLIVFFKFKKWL